MTVDTIAPTIAITSSKAALKAGDTATLTFTISEAVTDFDATDITVSGGTLSGFTGSGTTYTATFTPTANSTTNGVINVASSKFSDAAGNQNADGADPNNTVTLAVDTIVPTIAISPIAIDNIINDLEDNSPVAIAGTTTGVEDGRTVTVTLNSKTYTATVTSNAWTLNVPAADAQALAASSPVTADVSDLAGNPAVQATRTVAHDAILPTIAVTSDKPSLKVGDTATLTFTISEAVTDFVAADITVSGGTLSGFAGSGTSYTATFTPTANSNANGVINVANGKFTDAAGNQNADGADANNTVTLTVDTILPTIAITSDKPALKAGDTATLTFTLSEASTTFDATDITVSGGTLSGFTGSGTTYTATFTPAANSTTSAVINVASNKFSDAAGNQNADGADANNTVTLAVDTITPTIAITSSKASLKAGDTATLTFTLSEAATDFTAADITVTGGTLSGFTGSGTTYTATFTPTANSTTNGVINVASSKFSDAAGNQNADGADANNTITMAVDTIAPTIAISPIAIDNIINDLEDNSPVAIAGTTTGVEDGRTVTVTLNSKTYTATVTSNAWTLNVPAADAQALAGSSTVTADVSDLAGNPATQATRTVAHDATAPTIAISPIATDNIINALEDDTPVAIAGTTTGVEDGRIVTVTLNSKTYTATVTSNAWTLNVPAADAQALAASSTVTADVSDLAGNPAVQATRTVAHDATAPTIAISPITTDDIINALEDDTPVAIAGTTTGVEDGRTVTVTLHGITYTTTVTSNAWTLNVPAADAQALNATETVTADVSDLAGNPAVQATRPIAHDAAAPTVTIALSDAALSAGETSTVTFTFSEVPTGFDAADITAENGTISALTVTADPKVYTATFTPTVNIEDPTNIISVGTGYTDPSGNPGTTGTSANYTIDNIAPTVAIALSDTDITVGETSTVTFTFNEVPTGFTTADITAENGTISALTATADPKVYTAIFTPTANVTDLTNIISVGTSYTDPAGNPGTAGVSANYTIDTVAPTVTITLSDTALSVGETSTVTFTFSDPPTSFDITDITAGNGTISGLTATADPLVYTATFTPATNTESSTNVISVSTGYTIPPGNPGTSANFTIDTLIPTIAISPIAADDIINALEDDTPVAIAGTTTGVEDNQLVTVTLNGKTYTATVTSNAWAVSVPAADAQALPATNAVTADVSDLAGNPAVQATHTVAHDAIAPTITINAIATDDIINALEDDTPIAITGTTTGVEDNQTLTVTLHGITYTTIVTGNAWTVNVPAADAQALNASEIVTADVSDVAGNPAIQATRTIAHDDTAPTITINAIATDDIINALEDDTPVTITGTTTGVEDNQTLTVTLHGITYTTTVTGNAWTVNVPAADAQALNASEIVTADVSDLAGNPAVQATRTIAHDTVAPTITINAIATDDIINALEDDTPVTITGTTTGVEDNQTLTVTLHGITYTTTVTGNAWTVNVPAADAQALNASEIVTADVSDLAGNPAVQATRTIAHDTVAPTIVINPIATDDIINALEDDSPVAIAGTTTGVEDGQTLTVTLHGITYTTTVTGNAWTVNVPAADAQALNASEIVTADVSDFAGNPAVQATRTIAHDTVAPTIVINPIATDDIINALEDDSPVAIAGTTTGVEDGQTLTVTLHGITYTTTVTGNAWTVNVPAADAQALNASEIVTADVSDFAGNPAVQATRTIAHDTVAPTIVINPIATDDIINALEDDTPVAIAGTTTGVEDGQTLTVTLHGITYTTTVTGNAWTVNVPAADAQALNASEIVTADVSDFAGNPAAQATKTIAHDATAPTIVINPIATDDIINALEDDTPVAITGTTTGVEDNQTLTVTLHGITYTTTVTGNAWTVNVPAADAQALNASEIVTADVSDLAGNPAIQVTRTIAHDATAPTIVINPIAIDDIINALEDDSPVAIAGTTTGVEDGQTLTVTLHGITYTTTVTGNAWTVNLPAADAQALNASEIVTADVSDLAGNPAIQVTRTIAHDATAPTIVINPIATDDIINALEDDSPVAIAGTTTGVEDGQTLTVTLHGITYTTTVTGNAWTVNVPAADAQALNASEIVTADVSDFAGNPAVQATRTIAHDTVAPTIVINPIATDDIINALEDDSPVAIAGTTTGVEDGQTLTVTLHGITYTTTVTGNAWTVNVPAADAQALNASEIVTADVSDLAGNPAIQVTRTIAHDATAPTIVINPIAIDDIINALEDDTPVAIAGTTTGVEDGQTLTVTLHGITYTTTVTGNAWTLSIPAADAQALNASEIVTADVSDLAGNPAIQVTRTIAHDATAPTIVINPIAIDDIINALEDDSPVAIAGTTTGVEDGQTLTVTLHGITYTTLVTGNAWTVNVPAADAQALNASEIVTADVSDLAGNPAAQATKTIAHDTVAPTIVINPIAIDDIINALEDDSPVAIAGTTTGVEDGQTLTVTLHGITYTTTVTGNAWTVNVPAADAQALNASEIVTADVSDLAGNPAVQVTKTIAHDAIAPTIVINPIAIDDIINALEDDTPVAIAGTTTGVEDGQTLTVTLHGITYTTTVTGNAWTVNVPAADAQALNASEIVTADVSDLAGNPAIQVTRTIAHDAIAPAIVINPIAIDDIINALEDDSPVAIAGTTTGVEDGQTLTVTLHGITYTTTVTGNAWTVNVPAADAQALNASEIVTADVSDLAGNPAVQATRPITHDATAPTVTIVLSDPALIAGETSTVTFSFNKAPTGFDAADITVENGTVSALTATADPLVYTATFTPAVNIEDPTNIISVGTGYTDSAGNPGTAGTSANYTIDTIAPTVAINPIATDDIINGIEDDTPVVIAGTTTGVEDGQTLTVTLHGIAYTTLVTGNAWTVNVPAADAQALNASEIVTADVSDLAGNPAVQATKTIAHDTTVPTIAINPIAADNIINASEDDSPVAIAGTTTGVEDGQTLTVTLHGITYTTTVTGNAWTLSVPAADAQALNASEIVTADVSDLAGNPAVQATQTIAHDAIAPTIVINPIATDDIINALEDDSPVAIAGTTTGVEDGQTLTVTLHGITYTTTVTGNAWTVNVPAADAQALNASEIVTADVSDLAGNPAIQVTRTIAHDATAPTIVINPIATDDIINALEDDTPVAIAGTTTGVEDGQTLTVTLHGITYTTTVTGNAWTVNVPAADTQALNASEIVTADVSDLAGNPAVQATRTITHDAIAPTIVINPIATDDIINALEDDTPVAIAGTTTGVEDGQTLTVTLHGITYTTTVTGNAWTVNVPAADAQALNASEVVTADVSDLAGNPAVQGTKTIAHDATAPTIVINPIAIDDIINALEDDTPVAIAGTTTGVEDGQTLTVTLHGITYTTTVTGNAWTVNVPAADAQALNASEIVTADVSDLAGNPAIQVTRTIAHDATAPTIVINPIATDDIINALEDDTPVAIAGTTTGVEDGQTLTVTLHGITYTTTVNGNAWTVNVPAADAQALNASEIVTADVSDLAGNPAIQVARTIAHDATAPTIVINPIAIDDIINALEDDSPVAIAGTTTGVEDGQTLTVTLHGITYTTTVTGNAWTVNLPAADAQALNASEVVTADVSDLAGNPAVQATRTIAHDATAPTIVINPIAIDDIINALEDDTPVAIAGTTTGVEDGQTLTVTLHGITYTTTVTGNAWTVNLPAADAQALNASEVVTADVSDLAGNPAIQVTRTIAHDAIAPTIVINPIATDDIINALEDDTPVAIAGTTAGVEDGQTLTVTLHGITYTTTVTGNAWTVNVPAADAQALNASEIVTADVSDLAGNPAVQATRTIAHDAIAPTIVINPIATDDIINALEDDTPVAIAGTTTGVEDGQTLTVTLHGITYTTTVTGNAWTVNVPAADAQALNASEIVTADVSDLAGNPAVQATRTIAHDAIAPTIVINPIAIDDIINALEDDSPVAIAGTTTGVEDGQTLTVTLHGITYTTTVTGNAWTVNVPAADAQALNASEIVTADVSDLAGNPAIQVTRTIAHDATAPTIVINPIAIDDIINALEDDTPVAIAGTTTGVEDGQTLTVTLHGITYTTIVTGNAWTVNVPAADAQALNASEIVTADVSDLAGNPAIQVTRTIAHDTVAPAIVINPIATDDIINALEDDTPVAIAGTTTGVEDGQTLTVTLHGITYTTTVTGNAWTVNVPAADAQALNASEIVTVDVSDLAGNPAIQVTRTIAHDATAPTIVINPIAIDDIINALEDDSPVAIAGTTTGVEDGQTLTVTLHGITYTTTVTGNAWTLSVPAADAQALNASEIVTADVSDLAGNPAVQATRTIAHDTVAPTIVINPIATDDIINALEDDTPVAIAGTTTGVEDGQTLTVTLHGITYTTTVTGNAWTVNVPAADAQALNASEIVTADVSDFAGNPAVQVTKTIAHDTVAPTIVINPIATDDIINALEDDTPVAIAGTTTGVEDGQTLTVTLHGITYTTLVTGNAWTVNIPAADAQALNASEIVTADVSDLAGNPAVQVTKTIAHDAIAPTIVINPIATDDIINALEDDTPVAIAGTTTSVEDGQTLTVTLHGITYTTTVTGNAWTVNVPAVDAQALNASEIVTVDVSDLAGNPAIQVTKTIAHDATAPTIVINPIAIDDIINALEDDTPVAIAGTTTGVEDGQTLTVTLHGITYTTTVTGNAWTVNVPAADAQALNASEIVTADVSDLAGNPAIQVTKTIAHDAIAPAIVINPIATDDIINALEDDSPVAIAGTTTGVEDGQTLTVTLHGITYTTTVTGNAWTVNVPAADAQALNASEIVTVDVM